MLSVTFVMRLMTLHFFINCKNVKEFWSFWINWCENISRIPIKYSNVLNECILLDFPNNKEEIQVLNNCRFIYDNL